MGPPEHRRAAWARSFEGDSRTTQTIRRQLRGDENADEAVSIAGIFKFDRSMRMRRTQEAGVSLIGKSPIRDVHAPSAQQTPVFEAAQLLANPERLHEGSFVRPSMPDSRWVSQFVAPVVPTRLDSKYVLARLNVQSPPIKSYSSFANAPLALMRR
jgi:hypothetical protein